MFFCFVADDGLKCAYYGGERMGANGGADDVVGFVEVHDPGAHSFVDGVAEGAAANFDGDDLSTQEFDAEYVQGLAADVFGAHEDCAGHAEFGADGRRGNAMLACASFGDDFGFAQASGEENLAEGVVDFVGSSVVEVFTFEPDVCAPRVGG